MFLVNSRYRRFSATPFRSRSKSVHVARAHLLPKLRCQFAEFLNQSSLKRLGILSPPTCVGLRYGHQIISTRSFSWKHGINQLRVSLGNSPHHFSTSCRSVCRLRVLKQPSTSLNHHDHTVADLSFSVPSGFKNDLMVQEY